MIYDARSSINVIFFNSSSLMIAVQFGLVINDLLIDTNTWCDEVVRKFFLLLFIDMLYLYCYNGVAWTNKKEFAFCQSWSSQDSFPSYSLFVCVITKWKMIMNAYKLFWRIHTVANFPLPTNLMFIKLRAFIESISLANFYIIVAKIHSVPSIFDVWRLLSI